MGLFNAVRRRPARWTAAAMTAGALLAGVATAVSPAGAANGPAAAGVVHIPVSFQVRNVNRSAVPCHADGREYTVRGDLVAPASMMSSAASARAITLYLHGLSFGEFFWNFDAVPGYDYSQKLAEAGQASLIVDRLGYGKSGKPAGTAICVGSRADIAHQMVLDLRSGKYTAGNGAAPTFGKVFLAGHSYGGQITEVEAYSFGDVDGIAVISYSDVGQTAQLRKNARYTAKVCAMGGVPVTPHGPGGYAPFGNPAGATASLFNDVDPAVKAAALPMLTKDPCGDGASFPKATRVDLKMVHKIDVPVLLIQGGADALFAASAQPAQAALFTGAPSVRTVVIANTAHAITLERTRDQFANRMAATLQSFENRTA